MSNSTTNLDLINSGQANKEVTANALFDAASPAMIFGRRASTSAALTWGYYGGTTLVAGTPTSVANGTVALTASDTNYVEADPATGVVSVNLVGFTSGMIPLYEIVTGTASVTSYTDKRTLSSVSGGVTSVNGDTGPAVVLTAADVGAEASGAVATHVAAADPHPQYLTQTEGDARYPLASATGTAAALASDTDGTLAANSDSRIATQKATKTYVDSQISGDIATHVAAADPHTQYALESSLGTASTLAFDTDGTLAANSDARIATQKATKTYVDSIVTGGASDVMIFKGVIDCSANPNYPAADAGNLYKVSVAGKIGGASGPAVEPGDTAYCLTDSSAAGNHATVGANWVITQVNIDGAVTGPSSAVDSRVAMFDGPTGKIIKDSGLTLAGANTGDETTTTAGALINGAASKATPVDADYVGLMDSAASNLLKKLSWANIKATLKTYFDTLYASFGQTVNAQTGTTYTYLDGDRSKLVTHSNAAAIAGTLPQAGAGSAFIAGWYTDVQNRGAGTLTITPTTSTIDGAATLAFTTGQGARIVSDGTNYFTQRGGAGASAGGGLTNWTDAANTASPNGTVPVVSLTATNAATNVDAVLKPKGAGCIAAAIADGTSAGGNKRSQYAVDWQMRRSLAAQVASGDTSVVSGGEANKAFNAYDVVAGGKTNTASGAYSAAVGGNGNTASAIGSVVGGWTCTASSTCAVAFGETATASGSYSLAVGYTVTASGGNSFARGDHTLANSSHSQASGYFTSTRTIIGARVHSPTAFNDYGECQSINVVLAGATTNATAKVLTANQSAAGTTNQLTVQNNSAITAVGRVVARASTTGDVASWTFSAAIKRVSGTTSMVAACTPVSVAADAGASAWTLTVTADTTNNALAVTFTGAAATNINIICEIDAVELVKA